ncbi:MAG: hypothetical protein ACRD8W_01505 [Nitrososphaeraceae archaeon]
MEKSQSNIHPFLCNFVDEIYDLHAEESMDLRNYLIQKQILTQKRYSDAQVLIITNKYDLEADLVGIHLLKRGIDYVRLNIDELTDFFRVSGYVSNGSEPKFLCSSRGIDIDLTHIAVVFLRNYDLSALKIGRNMLDYIFSIQQWENALISLEGSLRCPWLNSYNVNKRASDRMKQLSLASKYGFSVPSSLITNDPETAKEFYHLNNGEVMIKCLYHHRIDIQEKAYSIYTRRVLEKDLNMFHALAAAPCILQQKLKKTFELRVHVIEDTVHSIRMKPPTESYDDIHRYQFQDLKMELMSLPENISEMCRKIIDSLGLKYGAIDLVIDEKDDFQFLEVNATPDWLWVERNVPIPITESMVGLIEKHSANGHKDGN